MTTHIYIYLSKDYPAGGYVVDYHGYEDYFLSLLKIMSERKIKKKKIHELQYRPPLEDQKYQREFKGYRAFFRSFRASID